MQARRSALLMVVVIANLLGSCSPPDTSSAQANDAAPSAADPRFIKVEKLARQSCLCKLAGHDSSKVDAALDAATAGLEVGGFVESSTPLSGDYTCYPELGERACVATYYFPSSPNAPRVCNLEQVADLEKAWKSASLTSDGSTDAAHVVLQKRLSELRRSVASAIPQSACN